MASQSSTDPSSSALNSTDNNSVLNSTSARAVSLTVILILGLTGNIFVIASVGGSRKLRTSAVYIFSLNVAVTNLIDCLLNITLMLGATVSNAWLFGELICNLSSFFMTLISIELTLSLTFMSLDRMIATKHSSKYDQLQTIPRTCTMITYTWIHSLAFSLPVATGTVPTKIHSEIYTCMISDKTSFIYVCILSISSFIIPLIIICALHIVIMKTAYTERSAVRAVLAQHQYSRDIEEPKFCKELYTAKYVGVLVLFWIILHIPYVVNLFFHLYKYSKELNSESETFVEYVWYLDTLLLWMKFAFVIVLPILLIFFNKDLRDAVRCRKNNAVVDIVGKIDGSKKTKSDKCKNVHEKNLAKEDKAKEAFTHNSGFQIPVLFATSHGVHIQTYDEEAQSECDDQTIRGRKCDVLGSQDLLNQVGGEETSDYDSGNEIDPFSVSHPVSSRNLNNTHSLAQRRSNSQPEVRSKKTEKRNSDALVSVAAFSTTDSGLDISSGGTTLTNKTLVNQVDSIISQRPSSYTEGQTKSDPHQIQTLYDDIHSRSLEECDKQNSEQISKQFTDSITVEGNIYSDTNSQLPCATMPVDNISGKNQNTDDGKAEVSLQNKQDMESGVMEFAKSASAISANKFDEHVSGDKHDESINEIVGNVLTNDDECVHDPSIKNKNEHTKNETDADINSLISSVKSDASDKDLVSAQTPKNTGKSTSNKKRHKKHNRKEKDIGLQEGVVSPAGLLRPPVRLEPLLTSNSKTLYNRLIEDDPKLFSETQKPEGHSADNEMEKWENSQTDVLHKQFSQSIQTLKNPPKRTLKNKKSAMTKLLMPDSTSTPSTCNQDVVTPSACDVIDMSGDSSTISQDFTSNV